ncbi:MAG TPA: serine/threonine-protein kinase [Pyrinomonadaceae bacterium]|nr:serine/threonine-protein kinase [Pyrinomonadaceae bacterium]
MASKQKIIRERYKIIEEIARGGMGVVYLATDLLTNSKVALKTNSWSGEQNVQKAFETEAKLLARLENAGLPKVRDYFILDGNFQALVMDFVEGETLMELLESGRYRVGCALDAGLVVEWGIQVLEILCYLHRFTPPVIHRDIKPNNIKLKGDGTIVLLDFGLAKGTAVSVVSGASSYSSLEQLNLATTDARSDIYALGATLFHLLTNYYPLNALDRFQGFHGISSIVSGNSPDKTSLQANPQKTVSEVNPRVPPEISEIVMKAMSLFPQDRFQTAEEMKTALQTAKQAFGGSFAAFSDNKNGANTGFNNPGTFTALKSLLDEEEEILGA